MAASAKLSFPLLSDQKLTAIRAYGVLDEENQIAWPAVFIIGRDGRVAWRDLTDSYKKRPPVSAILEHLPARGQG